MILLLLHKFTKWNYILSLSDSSNYISLFKLLRKISFSVSDAAGCLKELVIVSSNCLWPWKLFVRSVSYKNDRRKKDCKEALHRKTKRPHSTFHTLFSTALHLILNGDECYF
jgi:hypothetical protein